ncbi:MAG: murein L,D-transpeptidase [Marinibacterium sp.]|nr:murein L,D-transpeptidase [Marinibacterium sp.]
MTVLFVTLMALYLALPLPDGLVRPPAVDDRPLAVQLDEAGLDLGAPAFIRVFKEDATLELWLQDDAGYRLFKTYPICRYSGALGPKLKEGDRQAPEGFYSVARSAMNPNSRYHLSFNLGFPNAYDRAHGRTGSYLMIHGDCVSAGCYAMTDRGIEEIYRIVEAAQNAGQRAVPVHAFPFRMTDERMARESDHRWYDTWRNFKEGYDLFETTGQPPQVSVAGRRYVFDG